MDWPESKKRRSFSALYHNNKDGTFTDVTHQAGLGVEMYGIGVAVADYDNDGNDDIYITCVGPNHLFRNLGDGKFADVTAKAGLARSGLLVSAAWFDYDNDGKLDLFVGNYVEWTVQTDRFCTLDGKNKSYCTPQTYKGQSSPLYHNRGNGSFENVTARAGVNDPAGKDTRRRVTRLRRRRLDGSLRRQRHRTKQALSQQPQRHVHRQRRDRRRCFQRGRNCSRGNGRRRCGLRWLRETERRHR